MNSFEVIATSYQGLLYSPHFVCTLLLLHANNKGADQPALQRSQLALETMIAKPATNQKLKFHRPTCVCGSRQLQRGLGGGGGGGGGGIASRGKSIPPPPLSSPISKFQTVWIHISMPYQGLSIPESPWTYTTLTNFSTKYLMMCKVYTDVGGIK